MGWTFYHRDKGESNVAHFQKQFGQGYEIIDGATVGGTFYAAVRDPNGLVSAAVILTRWVPNDPYNFGYKDMTESMGPGEARCPARILDLLSPTIDLYGPVLYKQACDTHYDCSWDTSKPPHPGQHDEPSGAAAAANEWRGACRIYANLMSRIKRGTRIKLPTVDSPYKVWEVADLRRNRFYPVSEAGDTIVWGPPHRIPWWRSGIFEIVEKPTSIRSR